MRSARSSSSSSDEVDGSPPASPTQSSSLELEPTMAEGTEGVADWNGRGRKGVERAREVSGVGFRTRVWLRICLWG